jgi:uncharacterized protein (UPF0147 family)
MFATNQKQGIEGIKDALVELHDDNTVPKNVREKAQEMIVILNNEADELSIRKDKVLQCLDEISQDTNLQSYTRTQIWNTVSMLEKV